MIDAYISELDSRLYGPRRAKADLLAEARDSLVDAASAYESRGWAREAAERRAVGEFGEVELIAPDYQTELGLAQGRRTAILIFVVLMAEPFIWKHAGPTVIVDRTGQPAPGQAIIDQLMSWLGTTAILGAVLAALSCGIGVRYLGVPRRVIRLIAVFAYGVCVVFSLAGTAMTALSSKAGLLPNALGLLWLVVFLMIPLAGIGLSARRCSIAG